MALAPALVETYSRLLVYTEIESLGIKGFISKLTSETLRMIFAYTDVTDIWSCNIASEL
jgi:hypothetical protein